MPQQSIAVILADATARRSAVGLLRAHQYDVSTATDFETALKLLASTTPDLVLTGVDLGGGPSGFVLLRELRHRDEHRPVIMILEEHEIDDVLAAFRLGAVDVLLEPLRPSELLCIVDRVCGVAANEAAERAGLDTLGSGAFVKPVSDDLPGIDELSKETGQLDGEGEA